MAEGILWKTDLENEEFSAISRKMMVISKTNIEKIEMLVKKTEILEEIWQSLLNEPKEMIKGLMMVAKSLIGKGYREYQFEDAEIEDWLKEKIKKIISNLPGEQMEPAGEGPGWWKATLDEITPPPAETEIWNCEPLKAVENH